MVEKGVTQRIRALEAFLDDVYGSGLVFRDGVIPRQLIVSSNNFHRAAFGIRPPNGVRVRLRAHPPPRTSCASWTRPAMTGSV